MIWFALIIAVVVALGFGIITRNVAKAFRAGLITLAIGVILSLLIIYSGLMGG